MTDLEALESRVAGLEQKLLGTEGATADKRKLIDDLVSINQRINEVMPMENREKIKKTFQELPKIKKFLDPTFADSMSLSADAKLRLIDCGTPVLEQRIQQLELCQELLPVLDSEHIQKTPSLKPKLMQLSSRQVDQMQQVAERNSEVGELLASYNEVISNLNKQFAFWDAQLTKAEKSRGK